MNWIFAKIQISNPIHKIPKASNPDTIQTNSADKVLQVTFSILRKPPSKISTILKKGPIHETCKYFRQCVAVNVVKIRQSSEYCNLENRRRRGGKRRLFPLGRCGRLTEAEALPPPTGSGRSGLQDIQVQCKSAQIKEQVHNDSSSSPIRWATASCCYMFRVFRQATMTGYMINSRHPLRRNAYSTRLVGSLGESSTHNRNEGVLLRIANQILVPSG